MSAEAPPASRPQQELPQDAVSDSQQFLPEIAVGHETHASGVAQVPRQDVDTLTPTRLLTPEQAAEENEKAERIITADEAAWKHGYRVEIIGDHSSPASAAGYDAGTGLHGEGPRGKLAFPTYPLLHDVSKIHAALLNTVPRVPEVKALDEGAPSEEGESGPVHIPPIGPGFLSPEELLARSRAGAAGDAVGDGPGDASGGGGGERGGPGGPGGPGDGGGDERAPLGPEARVDGPEITDEILAAMVENLLGKENFAELAKRVLRNGEYNAFTRPRTQQELDAAPALTALAWQRIAENYDNPDLNIDGLIIQSIMDPNNTNNPVDQSRVEARAQEMFDGYQFLSESLEFNGTQQFGNRQVPIYTSHDGVRLTQFWTYLATRLTDIGTWTDRARSTEGLTERLNSTFNMPNPVQLDGELVSGPQTNVRFLGEGATDIGLTDKEIAFLQHPTFWEAHRDALGNDIPAQELEPGFSLADAATFFKFSREDLLALANRTGQFPIHHASRWQRTVIGNRNGHNPAVDFIDTLTEKILRATQQSNLTAEDRQLIAQYVPNNHGGTGAGYVERAKHGIGALQMLGTILEQLDSGEATLAQDEEQLSSRQRWDVLRITHEVHNRALQEAHQAARRAEQDAIAAEITELNDSVADGHVGEPEYDRVARRIRSIEQGRVAQAEVAGRVGMERRRVMLNLGARRDWRRRYEERLAAAAHPAAP